ncbi:hypothetical protein BGZ65_002022 [Modicella reniformis]|uniref:Uncharacterized protein n=1 Tax=Modicella reniformis TaxID=1440133 RepID=A0A9P6J1N0_9FUNG|nr:hypothetical protein BGZ65_002022 [Modicella reniformis]
MEPLYSKDRLATKDTYQCHHSPGTASKKGHCGGKIIIYTPIVLKKDKDEDEWIIQIEIFGYTKHPEKDKRINGVLDFIADNLRRELDVEGLSALLKNRKRAFTEYRKTLGSKSPIRFQGVWESRVSIRDIYDMWMEVVNAYQIFDKDESRSLRIWCERLKQKGCLTCEVSRN